MSYSSIAGYRVETHDDLSLIDAQQWDALGPPHLLTRHAFLRAFETTGCVGGRSGWQPQHLTLWRGDRLHAAAPLYLKFHSYGEYVFDWAWADAYERAGARYYPKLLCAIPFTPITCPKLLALDAPARAELSNALLAHARENRFSSFHALFLTEEEKEMLPAGAVLVRSGVQYHWHNRGYADFDAFLADFSRDKRKKIKQDRKKVSEAGVTFRWLTGAQCSDADWAFFNQCYRQTYREHHSSPYLNLQFFAMLGQLLPHNVLLVMAAVNERPVASALFLFDEERLYGRYWGSTAVIPNLHFEVCYYQAIEFCIAQGLKAFEGGAQGEHKIARGLLPARTYSAHWLADARFAEAIAAFLRRESIKVEDYLGAWAENSPLKPTTPFADLD
jgi:predicted N-acyltransferase